MEETTIRLSLELRVADGCISGRAVDETSTAREFDGWLGLVAAIDSFVPSASTQEEER